MVWTEGSVNRACQEDRETARRRHLHELKNKIETSADDVVMENRIGDLSRRDRRRLGLDEKQLLQWRARFHGASRHMQ
eukprot:655292-Hanusia_phi.AAC.1